MVTINHRKRHGNNDSEVEDPEPGLLPIDPDEGPIAPLIPEDPEHDRVVDPEA